jgi:hypothetical protein
MTPVKIHPLKVLFLFVTLAAGVRIHAQDWKSEKRINILVGLAQTVVARGLNIEGNYIHNRLIFDYSHGASLDFTGDLVPVDLKKQDVVIHEPWTTGFGIGYRLKEWINVRVEPKWHRFEFYYSGAAQNSSTEITSYNTFSLGVGVYGSYRPFKHTNNLVKGFVIAPSIRFWPTVSSSLGNEPFTYRNKKTAAFEEIKTLDPGTGFTPIVVNVSVGYSLQLKKKR